MNREITKRTFGTQRIPRSTRGVTLVEVLMAVLVLSTAVAATIMALRIGFSSIQLARDDTMAAQILQSEMEDLRMMSWKDLQELEEVEEFQVGRQFDPALAGRFRGERRVDEDVARPGMKEVELLLEWTASSGVEHQRVFRTLFSKEGLNDYYYVIAR